MTEKTAAFFSGLKQNLKNTDKNTHHDQQEEGLQSANETESGKGSIFSIPPLSGIQDDISGKTTAFFSGLKQNFQKAHHHEQEEVTQGENKTHGATESERNVLVEKIPSEKGKMVEDVNSDKVIGRKPAFRHRVTHLTQAISELSVKLTSWQEIRKNTIINLREGLKITRCGTLFLYLFLPFLPQKYAPPKKSTLLSFYPSQTERSLTT